MNRWSGSLIGRAAIEVELRSSDEKPTTVHSAVRQQLHQPHDELCSSAFNASSVGDIGLDAYRPAIGTPVHAVQHQAMQYCHATSHLTIFRRVAKGKPYC